MGERGGCGNWWGQQNESEWKVLNGKELIPI